MSPFTLAVVAATVTAAFFVRPIVLGILLRRSEREPVLCWEVPS
jgi:hypothetical protein